MRDDVGIKSRLNLYAWGGIQAVLSVINIKWNIININIMKRAKS